MALIGKSMWDAKMIFQKRTCAKGRRQPETHLVSHPNQWAIKDLQAKQHFATCKNAILEVLYVGGSEWDCVKW